MSIGIVSPREAQALIAQGAKLIDVRDADEYLREHIPHAQLAPLSRLEQGDLPANLRAEQIFFTVSQVNEPAAMQQNYRPLPPLLRSVYWKAASTDGKRQDCPSQKTNRNRCR